MLVCFKCEICVVLFVMFVFCFVLFVFCFVLFVFCFVFCFVLFCFVFFLSVRLEEVFVLTKCYSV